ncbi:hypothetical protein Btru_033711 [Bulinus truncatus]|nr:hypothetical protein Btru_033711 [Bulinus truncatus]
MYFRDPTSRSNVAANHHRDDKDTRDSKRQTHTLPHAGRFLVGHCPCFGSERTLNIRKLQMNVQVNTHSHKKCDVRPTAVRSRPRPDLLNDDRTNSENHI